MKAIPIRKIRRRRTYKPKPELKLCFGISPRTGKQVGARHRWPQGWGKGTCEFCRRTLHELRDT